MGEENQAVGIAEIKIAQSPDRLVAYGLGSCVGVSLYYAPSKIGGLAHVMLPSSRLHASETPPGKYADTAVLTLWIEMEKAGCRRNGMTAKIVGGANMFSDINQSAVPIGLRNVSAVRQKLEELEIPIAGEEVGGTKGRTMIFNLDDGGVEIRQLNQAVHYL